MLRVSRRLLLFVAGVPGLLLLAGGSIARAQVPSTEASSRIRNSVELAPSQRADYLNRYEVYGGLNFMNGQAGQNIPVRYNLGGGEVMGTYWLKHRLGVDADYRFDAGTTPLIPNPFYNRVVVFQNIFMGGVSYRGPSGRYAAVNYHALAGGSYGVFDHAIKNYPGGSPVSAAQVGLYNNHTAPFFAIGGSLDFNKSRHLAIRVSPDATIERFGTETRFFVAVSGGLMYRFGER